MSYDDELFPGGLPPFSRTYVDRSYCEVCMGLTCKTGAPNDGVFTEYQDKDGIHRHFTRVVPLVHPKEQGG